MEEENYSFEEPKQEIKQEPKNHTGAKKVLATITILGMLGLTALGVYKGIEAVNDYRETKRAESIVANYIDKDYLVTVPKTFLIDKAYDEEFCEGEKLVEQLQAASAAYCVIDNTYYTNDGSKIAILTYEITRKETAEPIAQEYNGTTIYMAPAGYTLENGSYVKTTTGTVTKIVPANSQSDYSNIQIINVDSFELVNVEEIDTLPYENIYGTTLICDVEDNAQLNENGFCEATFRLVPRKK
ncbi:MAG: hypothetical protein ACI4XM_01810 [Candidatus Coprovivens sp.]